MSTAIVASARPAQWLQINPKTLAERDALLLAPCLTDAAVDERNVDSVAAWIRQAGGWSQTFEEARIGLVREILKDQTEVNIRAHEAADELNEELERMTRGFNALLLKRENDRRAQEAEAAKERARLEQERVRLQQSARVVESEPERKELLAQAEVARVQRNQTYTPLAPPLPAGIKAKPKWVWELKDIKELFAVEPSWVVMTPDRVKINAAVLSGRRNVPGLEIKEVMQSKPQ